MFNIPGQLWLPLIAILQQLLFIIKQFLVRIRCELIIRPLYLPNLIPRQWHPLDTLPDKSHNKCIWSYRCHIWWFCGNYLVWVRFRLWSRGQDRRIGTVCRRCNVPRPWGIGGERVRLGNSGKWDLFRKGSWSSTGKLEKDNLGLKREDYAAEEEVIEILGTDVVHVGVLPDVTVVQFGLPLPAVHGDTVVLLTLSLIKQKFILRCSPSPCWWRNRCRIWSRGTRGSSPGERLLCTLTYKGTYCRRNARAAII